MRFIRHLRLSQRATASVELALCLPFLTALIFGSMEGGNYLLTEHKVVKGVRDGARYAARLPFGTYDCVTETINPDAMDDIKAITRTGRLVGGSSRVSGWDDSEVDVLLSCDDSTNTGLYRDLGTAPRVLVVTRVPYISVLGALGFNTRGATVRAQAHAAVAGA